MRAGLLKATLLVGETAMVPPSTPPPSTPPPSRSISDAELDVLKVLWSHGPTTVREILDELTGQGRSWAYTTVQTLLGRLVQKGFVSSDKRGRAHEFAAVVSRQDLLGEQLDDLVERVCDGVPGPLVLSLVQKEGFTPEDVQRFRKLLDDLESAHQAKKGDDGGE